MGRARKRAKPAGRATKPVARKSARSLGRKPATAGGGTVRGLAAQLAEAREQLTATGEILRVIADSPTAVEPVLAAVLASAGRLCGGDDVGILRVVGDELRWAAGRGPWIASVPGDLRIPLTRGSVATRAVVDRASVHVLDFLAEPDAEYPVGRELARRFGHRAMLAVPLLREGVAIGVICAFRLEPRAFSPQQIALLETFAAQAAIAIENARLFNELRQKNAALTAAHVRVISSSPTDVQPVFDAIAASASHLCEAEMAGLFRFDGELIHFVAQHGRTAEEIHAARRAFPQRPSHGSVTARAILARSVVQIEDVSRDPEAEPALRIFRTALSVPLLRDGRPLGAITVARRRVQPFTDEQIAVVRTFADQAVTAIENVRLFSELTDRNVALTEALEQQTATAEILRVISSSPTDPQPVFDAIVRSTLELCRAKFCVAYRYDGAQLHVVAHDNLTPETVALLSARYPQPPSRETATGVSVLERRIVHIPDATGGEGVPPGSYAFARAQGWASLLAVPLLRDGQPIGNIAVARVEPGPFTTQQIALVRTFADQAVIAIENVRLFRELDRKSRELEAASRHKSEFLANMSHELRTPLNAVIGFSEVLTERMFGELNDKQDEYLRDITASGQHLLSLINDILDLSKIEAGRMELELSDFDLPAAVDNALMLVRERAGRRGIALAQSIGEGVGAIRADERKVRQVLLNLLSNALKFTPEGGRVDVAAALRDKAVEVSVADTGVGISPEDQEAVFEEFRQVGTASSKIEGTGLGLTLCRRFVELHGGRIWVESRLGEGARFTFSLPLGREA